VTDLRQLMIVELRRRSGFVRVAALIRSNICEFSEGHEVFRLALASIEICCAHAAEEMYRIAVLTV
jgi:hypothetical protein